MILFNPRGLGASGVGFLTGCCHLFGIILNNGHRLYNLAGLDFRRFLSLATDLDNPIVKHVFQQRISQVAGALDDLEINQFYDMNGVYDKLISSSIKSGKVDHPACGKRTT